MLTNYIPLTTVDGPMVPGLPPAWVLVFQDRLDPAGLGESGVFVASFGHEELGVWNLREFGGFFCGWIFRDDPAHDWPGLAGRELVFGIIFTVLTHAALEVQNCVFHCRSLPPVLCKLLQDLWEVFHLCSELNGFSFLSFEPLSWICCFFFPHIRPFNDEEI